MVDTRKIRKEIQIIPLSHHHKNDEHSAMDDDERLAHTKQNYRREYILERKKNN